MSRTRPIHGKQMVSPDPPVIISPKHRQNHPPVPAQKAPRLHQIHARLKKKRHVYMYQKPIRAIHPSIVFVSASCIARMLFSYKTAGKSSN